MAVKVVFEATDNITPSLKRINKHIERLNKTTKSLTKFFHDSTDAMEKGGKVAGKFSGKLVNLVSNISALAGVLASLKVVSSLAPLKENLFKIQDVLADKLLAEGAKVRELKIEYERLAEARTRLYSKRADPAGKALGNSLFKDMAKIRVEIGELGVASDDLLAKWNVAHNELQAAMSKGGFAKLASAIGLTTQGLALALTGVGLLVAAIVILNIQIKLLVGFFKLLNKIVKTFIKVIKAVANAIKDLLVKALVLLAKTLSKIVVGAFNLVVKAGKGFIGFIKDIPNRVSQAVRFVSHLTTSVRNLGEMFTTVAEKVEEFITGAAELQGVKASFEVIAGLGSGGILSAMRQGSSGMAENIDLMKGYNNAALLVGETLTDTLPTVLSYLTKLSLATGDSVEYLLDSYVRGIGRLSPKIIDNLKIQTSVTEITTRALELQKERIALTGEEEGELTILNMQMAATDLVMQKLEVRTRNLADPTGSLTQMMAKFNVTMANNAKTLASHFIPAAKSLFILLNKLADNTTKNISKNGKWFNSIRYVSAALSVLAEEITKVIKEATEIKEDPFSNLGQKFVDIVADAFAWGAGLVSNFAQGMIHAGGNALISAINFISGILTYWMKPASPPKFLTDIFNWGSGTFTEFLRGFVDADFDVLTAVQNPLKSALRLLASVGEGIVTELNMGEIYADLSGSMAEAIASFAETGRISEETLSKLAAVGGGFGKELEELFKRQLAVAAATIAVVDAEKRLTDARKAEKTSSEELSKGAREYNKLLREGADAATLAAKLQELRGSYSTLVDAREAATIAEDDLVTAKEQSKEANRLAGLQSQLLQQLLDIASAREASRKAAEAEAEGDELFAPGDPYDSVVVPLDNAFQDLKDVIRTRFQELWKELRADWEASGIGQLMEDLKTAWENSSLKDWWDEFVLDVEEGNLRTALDKLWLKFAPTIQNWLDENHPWWADVWRAFTEEGIEDGSGKVDFIAGVTTLWTAIADSIQTKLDENDNWLAETWGAFTQEGIEDGSGKVDFTAGISTLWLSAANSLQEKLDEKESWWSTIWRAFTEEGIEDGSGRIDLRAGISTLWVEVGKSLSEKLLSKETWWANLWKAFFEKGFEDGSGKIDLSAGIEAIGVILGKGLVDLMYIFGELLATEILINMTPWERDGRTLGGALVDGMIDGMIQGFTDRKQTAFTKISIWLLELTQWLRDILGIHSPSTVMYNIGKNMGDGIRDGLSSTKEGIKTVLNEIIWYIERTANAVIDGINTMIRGFRSVPGAWWINEINRVQLPRLATGGIVTGDEQLAMLHGPEAVIPLNDARAMDMLRESFSGSSGGGNVEIHQHFGKDSVRSIRDIRNIADKTARVMRLQGVRAAL